jgi:hypothetical protein
MDTKEIVFSKNVIEFVTVGLEFCLLLERATSLNSKDFVDKCVKILPLMYLKASLLPAIDDESDEFPEEFVTEEAYAILVNQLAELFGDKDDYLETFHPDMALSDTAVIAHISEDLADIYQDVKNFISVYRLAFEPSMLDALKVCLDNFQNFWGQKLANAIGALHYVRYAIDDAETDDNLSQSDTF